MCELGKLYNKESVIQYILGSRDFFVTEEAKYLHENRQQFDDDFCHLTKLKVVCVCVVLYQAMEWQSVNFFSVWGRGGA